MSISLIQKLLLEEKLDGWLLYDFHGINPIFHKIVGLPKDRHVTRKVYYWIPSKGESVKIVHKIEAHVLDGVNGRLETYAKREELEDLLLQMKGKVAMEYSKDIPYISFVDGGTIDYLRSLNHVEIVSSGTLLQKLLSALDEEGIKTHLEACQVLDKVVDEAFTFIQKTLPYEKEVSNFILRRFEEEGYLTEHAPIVAKGANSANPHYEPKGKGDKIQRGDFVLIDLWCKKKKDHAVYGDITRVAILGEPSQKMRDAFEAVRGAQKVALKQVKAGVRGADVDQIARSYLEEKGYSPFILHRLGHSIDANLHGSGANFDSFESFDTRVLIPNTCYSIEPALYFPGEFGLRLEHDVLLTANGTQVTGGVQEEIKRL
jgi:Xaa-Pro aminopeptidase